MNHGLEQAGVRPGPVRTIRLRTSCAVLAASLAIASCSSGDDTSAPSAESVDAAPTTDIDASSSSSAPPLTTAAVTTAPPASAPTTAIPTTVSPSTSPSTAPTPPPAGRSAAELVRALADDALGGRDNQSPGGEAARALIIEELATFAEPIPDLGGFEQEFAAGTNVLAVVPGTDLADQYVIVGGHYDHLGDFGCNGQTDDDRICNGAADNASGVAAAIVVARAVAASAPRRSVVIALWDAEEDGLLGATEYVTRPVLPLDQTVAYVNFDILGSNLLPAASGWTVAIGAETGGDLLVEAVDAAGATTSLDVATLGLIFGQGRSDHAPFAAVGVPIVFLTDATNGCYHTVDDEIDQLDLDKLDEQIGIATSLIDDLASADDRPRFDGSAPPVSFSDAVGLAGLLEAVRPDLRLLEAGAAEIEAIAAAIDAIVEAGPGAFGDDDVATVIGAASQFISLLDAGPCP